MTGGSLLAGVEQVLERRSLADTRRSCVQYVWRANCRRPGSKPDPERLGNIAHSRICRSPAPPEFEEAAARGHGPGRSRPASRPLSQLSFLLGLSNGALHESGCLTHARVHP